MHMCRGVSNCAEVRIHRSMRVPRCRPLAISVMPDLVWSLGRHVALVAYPANNTRTSFVGTRRNWRPNSPCEIRRVRNCQRRRINR